MKDFMAWIIANEDWLKELLHLIVGLCAFIYTGVVHGKSKKRLSELEKKDEAEKELVQQLSELKKALERGK